MLMYLHPINAFPIFTIEIKTYQLWHNLEKYF